MWTTTIICENNLQSIILDYHVTKLTTKVTYFTKLLLPCSTGEARACSKRQSALVPPGGRRTGAGRRPGGGGGDRPAQSTTSGWRRRGSGGGAIFFFCDRVEGGARGRANREGVTRDTPRDGAPPSLEI
jgi:hypothetical protein